MKSEDVHSYQYTTEERRPCINLSKIADILINEVYLRQNCYT